MEVVAKHVVKNEIFESGEEPEDDKKKRTKDEEREDGDCVLKKPRLEREGWFEKSKKKTGPVVLGPKVFDSSIEMFDYFFNLLHFWPPDLDINKYEQMVLLDLLKKGHLKLDQKIGYGLRSFQVRIHPSWQSRCFFVMRNDESYEDFSFWKCIDKIIPLRENMKTKIVVDKVVENKISRGHQRAGSRGGRSCGGRRGRGRGLF